MSDHFYYFGEKAIDFITEFPGFIKDGPGHKIINDAVMNNKFEKWISSKAELNSINGEPQLKWDIPNKFGR